MSSGISINDDIDTLECPQCKAIWRERGEYNYDLGGWHYPEGSSYCPRNCRTKFLGIRIKGKVIMQGTLKLRSVLTKYELKNH